MKLDIRSAIRGQATANKAPGLGKVGARGTAFTKQVFKTCEYTAELVVGVVAGT